MTLSAAGRYTGCMNLTQLAKRLSVDKRRALADKAGIAPRYLDQLITGFRNNPSLRIMQQLAAADRRLTVPHMSADFAARAATNAKQHLQEPPGGP